MLFQRKMQSFGLVRLASVLPVEDSLKNLKQEKSITMDAFIAPVILLVLTQGSIQVY